MYRMLSPAYLAAAIADFVDQTEAMTEILDSIRLQTDDDPLHSSCEQQARWVKMFALRPPRPAPASDIDPGPESSRVSVRR